MTDRTVYFVVEASDGSVWGEMKPTAEKAMASAQRAVEAAIEDDDLDRADIPKQLAVVTLRCSAPTTAALAAGLAALHGHDEDVDEEEEGAAMARATAKWLRILSR